MTVRTLLVFSFGALCLAIALSAGAGWTPVTPLGDQRQWGPREENDFGPYAATNGRLTAVAWQTQNNVCRVVVIGEDGAPVNPHGTLLPTCGLVVGVMWDGTEFKVAVSSTGVNPGISSIYGVTAAGVIDDPTGIRIEADLTAIATNEREFLACASKARVCWFVGLDGQLSLPAIQLPFDNPAVSVDGYDFLVTGFACPTALCADREFVTLRVNRSGTSRSGFNDLWGLPPQVICAAAGKRLAVWRAAGYGNSGRRIVYAFLDDSGQPLSAPADLDVLTSLGLSDDPPSVTYDGEAFVVVWSANGSLELRAARIGLTGAIIERPFIIDKAQRGQVAARNPAITTMTAGLRLAWTAVDQSGTSVDVYREAGSAAGLTTANTTLLATVLPSQSGIRVSAGPENALAVWYEGGRTRSLHAAAISPGGVAADDATISTLRTNGWSPFMDVAAGRDGYLVAWTDWPDTRVARFDRNGKLVAGSITTVPDLFSSNRHPLHEKLLWDGSQYVIAGTDSRNRLTLLHINADGTPIDAQPQFLLPPVASQYGERSDVNVQTSVDGKVVTWREYEITTDLSPYKNFRACGGRLNGPPWSIPLPQCHSVPGGGDFAVQSRSTGDDVVMFWGDKDDHCLWAKRFPFDGDESAPVKLYCDESGRGLFYDVRWYDNQWLIVDERSQRLFRFDRQFQAPFPMQGWSPWRVNSFSPAFGGYILAGEQLVGEAGGVYRVFFQLDVTRRRRSAGQ